MNLPYRLAVLAFSLASPLAMHAQEEQNPAAVVPPNCTTGAITAKGPDGKPIASPAATAETTLAGKSVTIKYNTPSMRCRKIFGGLQPYDHWWRTGANPATTLVTATDLRIGDLTVPAGTYTLYSLPEQAPKPWQLIVNKQTGQWGTEYKQEMDLGRTPMKFKALAKPQEIMSISFEHANGKRAELHIRWENTDVWVPVEAK